MAKKVKTGVRAISMRELFTKKRKVMEFDGEWLDFMGKPERTGSMIIWGLSGNGKTRFAMKFANYIKKFGRVIYNSVEEGASETLTHAFIESGVCIDEKRIQIWDMVSLEDMKIELDKPKSPNIIIIDSLQHWDINITDYKKLVTKYRKKLFIFISHADGKDPAKGLGVSVLYDSNVKIRVDRFVASARSRCKGCKNKPFVIWREKAEELHGVSYDELVNKNNNNNKF